MADMNHSYESQAPGPMLQINDLHVHFETADGAVKAVSGVNLDAARGRTPGARRRIRLW